ncbi:MAG: ABC transporter permease [Dehalococcoidales bacterium]|nr:ABC transporter permease [Dehalococcoidales bacterium]
MNAIKNFAVQAYATYKGLFQWLNWPGYTSNVFLRPIARIILFALLGRFAIGSEKAQFFLIGITVQSMSGILMSGLSLSYGNEISYGTLPFLYASPVNRLANNLSRPVLHFPNALLVFASGLVAAWGILDLNLGGVNWLGFLVSVFIIAVSITAFAMLVGVFALPSYKTSGSFGDSGFVGTAIFVLTGAVIPITVFPAFVQEIAKLLPITNGLLAVRATFAGASLVSVSGYLLRELGTGLVYLALAIVAFALIERWAKRTGSLYGEA